MKPSYRFVFVVFLLLGIVLSACAATAQAAPGAQKVSADIVLTGTLESLDGTRWVVNGQAITVDPSDIKDGPFVVGDLVKVEGVVQPDGTFVVTRVEAPSAIDAAIPTFSPDDNTNANSNDANINDDNIKDDHSNDANINDDNGNDNSSTDVNINDDNVSNDNSAVINTNDNHSSGNDSDRHSGGDNSGSDDSGGDKGNSN